MGQNSSIPNEKRKILQIDASDSVITDVKAKSTRIIPISEYIKHEKCSKQLHDGLSKEMPGKTKNTQEETVNKTKDKRVKIDHLNKNISKTTPLKPIAPKISFTTSTLDVVVNKSRKPIEKYQSRINIKVHNTESTASVTQTPEIKQLYINEAYPRHRSHKLKKRTRDEVREHKEDRKPEEKEHLNKNIKQTFEQSTHHFHCYNDNLPLNKLSKIIPRNQFIVQTMLSITIPPKLGIPYGYQPQVCKKHSSRSIRWQSPKLQENPKYNAILSELKHRISSDEETSKPVSNTHNNEHLRWRKEPLQYNEELHYKPSSSEDYISKSSTKISDIKLDKMVTHFVSPKQALENWKNIHTLRQHRKLKVPNKPLEAVQSPKHIRQHGAILLNGSEIGERPDTRVDFRETLEKCLKIHHQRYSYEATRNFNLRKTTWVQDQHRRWHKVYFNQNIE